MKRITESLAKAAEQRFPINEDTRDKVRAVALGALAIAGVVAFAACMVLSHGALHSHSLISIFQGAKLGAEIAALGALTAYIGTLLLTRDTQAADKTRSDLQQKYLQASKNDAEFENRMTVLLEHKGNELYVARQSEKLAQEIAAQQREAGYPKAIGFAQKQKERLIALGGDEKIERADAKSAVHLMEAVIDKMKQEAFELANGHLEKGEIEGAEPLMKLFKGEALDELRFERIEAGIRAGKDIDSLFWQLDEIMVDDHNIERRNALRNKLEVIKACRFLDSTEEVSEEGWRKIDDLLDATEPAPLKDLLFSSIAHAGMRLNEVDEIVSSAIALINDQSMRRRAEKHHDGVKNARDRSQTITDRFNFTERLSDPVIQASLKNEIHTEQRLAKRVTESIKEIIEARLEVEREIVKKIEEFSKSTEKEGEEQSVLALDKLKFHELREQALRAIFSAA